MTTTDTAGFIPATIRDEDMVQAMALFSTPYARPREAVLREIAVNARDAHIAAGVTAPISVQLPMVEISGVGDDTTYTLIDQSLVIKDQGRGMSAEIVTDIFTNFVATTKRDKPQGQTGRLGIGATSPYGLTDHFFVETVHDGVLTRAELKLIDGHSHVRVTTEDTDRPSGTTVTIPLPNKHADVKKWVTIAKNLFYFWPTGSVEITGGYEYNDGRDDLRTEPQYRLIDWSSFEHYDQHLITDLCTEDMIVTDMSKRPYDLRRNLVRMGSIVYPIPGQGRYADSMKSLVIEAEIGEFEITPSREHVVESDANLLKARRARRQWAEQVGGDKLQTVTEAATTADVLRSVTHVPDLVLDAVYGGSSGLWIAGKKKNLPIDFRFTDPTSKNPRKLLEFLCYHPVRKTRISQHWVKHEHLPALLAGHGVIPASTSYDDSYYWDNYYNPRSGTHDPRTIRFLDSAKVTGAVMKKLPSWHKHNNTILYVIDKAKIAATTRATEMFSDLDKDLPWITVAEINDTMPDSGTGSDKWLTAEHVTTSHTAWAPRQHDGFTYSNRTWNDLGATSLRNYTRDNKSVDRTLQALRDHDNLKNVKDIVVTTKANLFDTEVFGPQQRGVLVIFGRHDTARIEDALGIPTHTLEEFEVKLVADLYRELDDQQRNDIALAGVFGTEVDMSRHADTFEELLIDPDSTDEEREIYQLFLERPALSELSETTRSTYGMLLAAGQLIIDEGTYDLPSGVVNLQLTPQLLVNEHVPAKLLKTVLRAEL